MTSCIQAIVEIIVVFLALFLSSETWDVPTLWTFFGVVALSKAAYLVLTSRELKEHRRSPGQDVVNKHLLDVMLLLPLFSFVIAGLDVGRFHWGPSVPVWLTQVGFVMVILSLSLSIWSMKVNPFFLPVVRIQKEQHVVASGPYSVVRHPGNLASVVLFLFSGLALGSWWSFVAFLPAVLMMLRHTVLEDSFLKEHLLGYAEFAKGVNYRCIPGVW